MKKSKKEFTNIIKGSNPHEAGHRFQQDRQNMLDLEAAFTDPHRFVVHLHIQGHVVSIDVGPFRLDVMYERLLSHIH